MDKNPNLSKDRSLKQFPNTKFNLKEEGGKKGGENKEHAPWTAYIIKMDKNPNFIIFGE